MVRLPIAIVLATLICAAGMAFGWDTSTASAAAPASNSYDIAILNGRVMDPETGLDAIRNVGIRDGKIVEISFNTLEARTTLDAQDLVVAPGFIDLHQHGQNPAIDPLKIADGVTTALELENGAADIDTWYSARERNALLNFGASIGHIPTRMTVMRDPGDLLPAGDAAKRSATAGELELINAGIEKGLRRGAVAVGLGPAYTPAATNLEVLNVFKVAARHGASVHVHIKGSDTDGLFSGFQEVIADAAATGAALHIVHIQGTSGPNLIHELDMIRGARARGLDITTEAYPYDRGATLIQSALFDNKENEPDGYFAALLWPATGEYLTRESFLRYRMVGGRVIYPATTLAMVRAAISDPLTMIASDGSTDPRQAHPRTAGTYARVLGVYVREEGALSLMDALRKMTLMPAQRLERRVPAMRNKGRLRAGADADITVFDPATVRDASTYAQPALTSVGIRHVLVNGVPVLKDGQLQTRVAPGKPIRAAIE